MAMGYDKKSFLTGLAVGRNLRSYPMLEASEYNVAVQVFWTETAYPCKLSTGEASEQFIKIEYSHDPLYGARLIKYFLMHNTASDTYNVVFVNKRDETSSSGWRETTYGYTTEVDRTALQGAYFTRAGASGVWYYNTLECFTGSEGTLIVDASLIFTGTMNDMLTFLSTAQLVTVGDNLYLVGRGS